MAKQLTLTVLTLCLAMAGITSLTGCNGDTHASFHSGGDPRLRHDIKRTAHDIDHDVNGGIGDPHFGGEW